LLAPDVVLAHGGSTVGPLLQATRTVPIVFPVAVDPVGAGFVDSLARPGGNATGFMLSEYDTGGKWLELLKEIAPITNAAGELERAGLIERGRQQVTILDRRGLTAVSCECYQLVRERACVYRKLYPC
jgi:hypothetical protein